MEEIKQRLINAIILIKKIQAELPEDKQGEENGITINVDQAEVIVNSYTQLKEAFEKLLEEYSIDLFLPENTRLEIVKDWKQKAGLPL